MEDQGLNFVLGKLTVVAVSRSYLICKLGNKKFLVSLTEYTDSVCKISSIESGNCKHSTNSYC